jgi:hypothetical protein
MIVAYRQPHNLKNILFPRHFQEALSGELRPPAAGYNKDASCPVGYEQYTDIQYLEVSCPNDSLGLGLGTTGIWYGR